MLSPLTLRPQEIDEAARRRLVKRLYIPLPDAGAREQIISSLLSQQKCSLTDKEIKHIVQQTQGMSHMNLPTGPGCGYSVLCMAK